MAAAASHAPRIEPLTDLHPSLMLQGVRMEGGQGSRCSKQARASSVHSRFWHLSVRASHDAGEYPGCQSCSWYLQGKEEVSLFLFVDQDDLFPCPSWRGRQEQAAQSVLLDMVYSSFKGQKGQVVTHLTALTQICETVQVFTPAE